MKNVKSIFFQDNENIKTMPKRPGPISNSTLPDRERDICLRCRNVRIESGMKLAAFADVMNIPVGRLKSYELARAPIRYDLAATMCASFNVNQSWLAWGRLPRRPYVQVPIEVARYVPSRMLFSEVYDRLLDELILEVWASIGGVNRFREEELSDLDLAIGSKQIGASERSLRKEFIEINLGSLLSSRAEKVPSILLDKLYVELGNLLQDFEKRHRSKIEEYRLELERNPLKESESDQIKEYVESRLGRTIWPPVSPVVGNENYWKHGALSGFALTENTSQRISAVDEEIPSNMQNQANSISERLRAAIGKTELSQTKFADKYGINRRSLENWIYRGREPRGLYRERIEKILEKIEGGGK